MTKSTKKTTAKAAGDEKPAAKKKAVAKKAGAKKAAVKKAATTGKTTVKKTVAKKTAAPQKNTAAATKSAATPKPGGSQSAPGKRTVASTAAKRPAGVISGAQRHAMIAEAAYLRAEAHGFATDSHTDWVHAENDIDTRLARDGILVKN